MIIGFVCTTVFLCAALAAIINDEKKRHAQYKQDVSSALNQLRTSYGVQADEMKRIEEDFEEKEARGGNKEDDAAMIAEIN